MIKKIIKSSASDHFNEQSWSGYPHKMSLSSLLKFGFTESQINGLAYILGGKLILNRSEILEAKCDFRKHYRIKNDPNHPKFDKLLIVNWSDLQAKAQAVADANHVDPLSLVLICYHRLDTSTNSWFISVEICILKDFTAPPNADTYYDIIATGVYVDITTTGLKNTNPGDIGVGTNNIYGRDYFDNIEYSVDSTNFNPLSLNDNVRATLIAWFEIDKMYLHNIDASRDSALFELCFMSMTGDYSGTTNMSNVQFPHTFCVYSRYDDTDLLDDGDIVVNYFQNKAEDYQTLCPPNCKKYFWPAPLKFFLQNL